MAFDKMLNMFDSERTTATKLAIKIPSFCMYSMEQNEAMTLLDNELSLFDHFIFLMNFVFRAREGHISPQYSPTL